MMPVCCVYENLQLFKPSNPPLFVGARFRRPLVLTNRFLIPKNIRFKKTQPQRGGMFIGNVYSSSPKAPAGRHIYLLGREASSTYEPGAYTNLPFSSAVMESDGVCLLCYFP